jgi:hypothetical protein
MYATAAIWFPLKVIIIDNLKKNSMLAPHEIIAL